MVHSAEGVVISSIQPVRIVQYAMATGWQRVSNRRDDVAVFRDPQDRYQQLLVPLHRDYDDYTERVTDVISRLSRREQRLWQDVAQELSGPLADLMHFRIDDPETADGSVPFPDGLELIRAAERSLRSAACSVIESKPFFARLSRSESDLLIQNARLGQTKRGSFVAVVVVPLDSVPDHPQMVMFEPNVPFARRTSSYLMGSVSHIQRSVAIDQIDALERPGPDGVVVSANLCDALLAMRPLSAVGSLEVFVEWAKAPLPSPAVPSRIRISAEQFPAIETVAERLRPVQPPEPDRFIGKVTALMGKPNADGVMEGEVVLQFQDGEDLARAKLALGPAHYAKACDAHKASGYVSVEGTLRRRFRLHQIENARQFIVM